MHNKYAGHSLLHQVDSYVVGLQNRLRSLLAAGKYTVLGQVIDGMDVLDKMEKIKVGMCALFACD